MVWLLDLIKCLLTDVESDWGAILHKLTFGNGNSQKVKAFHTQTHIVGK